ncbi:UNVERIFIED_CONTAM: hypothetical protein Sangu_2926400 [Sesamum angustifolium]|uniref:Uncharacterized protein n=1 Tax=Sesamum angustifolium TaxID=2727405 RepID=A0AAW2IKZ8_9LAMI
MAFALVAAAAALGAANAAALGVEGGPALDCELLCVATLSVSARSLPEQARPGSDSP